jgi:transcriptional regulator with XRE-family HTH domain
MYIALYLMTDLITILLSNIMKVSSLFKIKVNISSIYFLTMTIKTSKPLKDRLQETMKARGVKIPKLARETKIPKDRIYAWYRDNTSPKADDQVILEQWITQKPPQQDGDSFISKTGDSSSSDNALAEIAHGNRLLAESVRVQAEANKVQAEANKTSEETKLILAKSNEDLIGIIKSTGSGAPNTVLNEAEVLVPIAEILAELATGKLHFHSKKEALAELGIRLSLHKPAKANLNRTHSGGDR